MKRKTLIVGVPHSGNHFLMEFLARLGLNGRSGDFSKDTNCDYMHCHPNTAIFKEHAFSDWCSGVIIPLRHPYLSVSTGHFAGAPPAKIQQSWDLMVEEMAKHNTVLFLVIDGPKELRMPQCRAIAEHFSKGHLMDTAELISFVEAWKPVNATLSEDDRLCVSGAVDLYERLTVDQPELRYGT